MRLSRKKNMWVKEIWWKSKKKRKMRKRRRRCGWSCSTWVMKKAWNVKKGWRWTPKWKAFTLSRPLMSISWPKTPTTSLTSTRSTAKSSKTSKTSNQNNSRTKKWLPKSWISDITFALIIWKKLTKVSRVFRNQVCGRTWLRCVSGANDWTWPKSALAKCVSEEEAKVLEKVKENLNNRRKWQWWLFSWIWKGRLRNCIKSVEDGTCSTKCTKMMEGTSRV